MNIQAQYGPLRDEVNAAIMGVVDTGHFILGAAAVMMGAGGLWLRKLVNPEV